MIGMKFPCSPVVPPRFATESGGTRSDAESDKLSNMSSASSTWKETAVSSEGGSWSTRARSGSSPMTWMCVGAPSAAESARSRR
jgi:hypothetical protein